jgi:hypothetical protein
MNIRNFITKTDYPEFKKMMLQEFLTKPLDIKATTTASIALEVKASQIAIEKLVKAFKAFEIMAKPETKEKESWK